ncbi:mannonate dehydratase [Eubacteriales bacterium OttesenSCG-928-G02]|nr:mannonate dehydratase [Eubacteriales bacterium OttesenSCG-928-G02]
MKMTFRWYGESDSINIDYISQIPNMHGVVSAVYDVPVGEVWSNETIAKIKTIANNANLGFEVVESVPVHEDIKLGKPTRDKYIVNYIENIKRLAAHGIKVICYNFMPVFDWLRSELDHTNPDKSTSLIYKHKQVLDMDPNKGELSLPGWDSSYTKDQLSSLLNDYKNITEEDLWTNLKYFLDAIIPTCEKFDVKMAIHPDDPPWSIFGLPRIITNFENLKRFISLNNSIYNGLTLCTGSLGASPDNDIPFLLEYFGKLGRIHFVHIRNVLITGDKGFNETAHPSGYGSLDMYKIIKTLNDVDFNGYVRPDHGRMIWGETGKPGYGLYDRALGAVYLFGLWEAVEKSKEQK